MDIAATNRMDRMAFVATFGDIFEHSPWVAERAFGARPFASIAALHDAMTAAVRTASRDEQLALLRLHPDLAGKEAQEGTMTDSSVAEQASAGLDRLTKAEIAELTQLNAAYRNKHGCPFIIAVRQHTKDGIFAEFARRLGNDSTTELAADLQQIFASTRMRLGKLFGEEEAKSATAVAAGRLTFHGIDTYHGATIGRLTVAVALHDGDRYQPLTTFETVINGRSDGAIFEGPAFKAGRYELTVHVGAYYEALGTKLPSPPFVTNVPLRFGVADPRERYHIAFLFGPWSYSFYRGS